MSGTLSKLQLDELGRLSCRTLEFANAEARRAAEYLVLDNFVLAEEHARAYRQFSRRRAHIQGLLEAVTLDLTALAETSDAAASS